MLVHHHLIAIWDHRPAALVRLAQVRVVYAPSMNGPRFPIRVGPRSRPFLRLLFGVRADDTWIDLGDRPDRDLEVQFGWCHFRTPMANLASWTIEGPWKWITAIGVRRSFRHGDVTFGGSPHGGVRINFRTPVPWLAFRVPAIYVPADDLERLAAALADRGVPGHDARTGAGSGRRARLVR